MLNFEALITLLDRSKKRLALAFAVALLLHFPLTPALPMLRLAKRLTIKAETQKVPSPPQEVEVDLREVMRSEEHRQRKAAAEPASKPADITMAPPPSVKFASSTPDPEPESSEAKARDLRNEKVKSIGLEGASKALIGKPAVTVGLWFSSLRDTQLGKRMTEIAACDREWKRFLDHGIEPLNDLEGVLIVGPGLFDSSQLTAAVHHNLDAQKVHGVMETLVAESGGNGRWLAADAASARLGRRQRTLLTKNVGLFFVTPSKGWEALHKAKDGLSVPTAEGRTASLVLDKPNQTLSRVGLSLPKHIAELRLELFSNLDQSLDLKLELESTSAESAGRDQKRISRDLSEFLAEVWTASSALGVIAGTHSGDRRQESAPNLDLELDQRTLSGTVHLSSSQAQSTLDLVSSLLCKNKKPQQKVTAAQRSH